MSLLGLSDAFLMIMLIALTGAFIFFISTLINLLRKKESSNLDFKRTLIFLGLAILFFFLFGMTL